ncbi:MAG: CRISPR-associated RAMP protein Csx7 [Candidatus Nitrosocaldaceae archaeon]
MSEWFVHHKIFRELEVRFTLETLSSIRIGSTKSKSFLSPIDLQVLRINLNGKDIPYIPGSSLKGVFRSNCESIIRNFNKRSCMMGLCADENNEVLQYYIKVNDIPKIIDTLSTYCLTCKLFGSKTYGSHILFNDAYPIDINNATIGVKTGIAINRRSGTAQKSALYTIEFVNPNIKFNFGITLINIPNYAIGLISNIIDMINDGFIKIGGFKSRGFGRVRLTIDSINGIFYTPKGIKYLKEVDKLDALDQYDEDITLEHQKPDSLLIKSKKVWNDYVNKSI